MSGVTLFPAAAAPAAGPQEAVDLRGIDGELDVPPAQRQALGDLPCGGGVRVAGLDARLVELALHDPSPLAAPSDAHDLARSHQQHPLVVVRGAVLALRVPTSISHRPPVRRRRSLRTCGNVAARTRAAI
jgi:hypothetical protein